MVLNDCKIDMPDEGKNIIEFDGFQKQLPVPFIVYADLESILKKPTSEFCKTGSTEAYQEHEAYSVGYYFKSEYDDSKSYYKANRGTNCVSWFVNELHRISFEVCNILNNNKPMKLTADDEKKFKEATNCYICEKVFISTDKKVRDHNHITGDFRGAAHNACNLLHQECRTIPVIFHNLSGYDSHFFIKELSSAFKGEISIVPINDQHYISFTKTVVYGKNKGFKRNIRLKFIDSFRFMASSLDKLASYLPSERKTVLHKEFQHLPTDKLSLLERKGVFPYDYVDCWEKLDEDFLPRRVDFHSRLIDESISDADYMFAARIWNEFDCKNLGEYSDLYLKTDILLLTDVFENFRTTCQRIYGLDPAHYFTAPGFSWDAMLKYTKVKIELFTEIDMLLFIERGNHFLFLNNMH